MMATRLIFLCAAATASSRIGAFPSTAEPLDADALRKAEAVHLRASQPDLVLSSPSKAAIETAEAFKLDALFEPLVADLDYGEWAGRTLEEVHLKSPEMLERWMADPSLAPPGGETMASLIERMATVIDRSVGEMRSGVIVTHAAPIRAAMAYALAIPIPSAMRIDMAPLTTLTLSHHGVWRLQELRQARI